MASAQNETALEADRLQALVDEISQMYAERYECDIPPVNVLYNKRRTKSMFGKYDSPTATITIYNHSDNEQEETNTVIHECAHHLQHQMETVDDGKIFNRPGKKHGPTFQLHYHRLVCLARTKGFYTEPYEADLPLKSLLDELRSIKRRDGNSAIRMGELFSKAKDRCKKVGASFELFIKDGCGFHRSLVYDYIKAWEFGLPADLGVARLRFVLRVPKPLRQKAIQDSRDGVPLELLRTRYRPNLAQKPADEEIVRNPHEKLRWLRSREARLWKDYQSVKQRRMELESKWCVTPEDEPMSTD